MVNYDNVSVFIANAIPSDVNAVPSLTNAMMKHDIVSLLLPIVFRYGVNPAGETVHDSTFFFDMRKNPYNCELLFVKIENNFYISKYYINYFF